MEAIILDFTFKQVGIIDAFESFIWTERYQGCGNFEVYMPISQLQHLDIRDGYYLWLKDSDQVMIIEDIQINSEVETGTMLIVSGRSLESILDRRIIWNQTVLTGNLQNAIQRLLNENVINPAISGRKISNFVFKASSDPTITNLQVAAQFTGDNLYEAILSICETFSIGFVVELVDDQFEFSLYNGKDRSYEQTTNPYVIFSPSFENIINSNYYESSKPFKNVTLVAGEDKGAARKTRIIGNVSGLSRRELYTDARDIQSEVDGRTLTDAEYNAQLDQRGRQKLAENLYVKSFEGQVEALRMFVYGRDFYKGDVVQIVNEYGIGSRVRVMEFVRCHDTTGYETYPTFSVIE